jgi:hypothetical protein
LKDESIQSKIEDLVDEEHRLLEVRLSPAAAAERHRRLQEVQTELDRCWDLLRQRRAREEFDLDPDVVRVRDADTVESYKQ